MLDPWLMAVSMMIQTTTALPVNDERFGWAEFSRSPSRGGNRVTVEMGTFRAGRGGPLHYSFRKVEGSRSEGMVESRADSRTCPQAREAIARLRDLELPRPAPPGFDDDNARIILDGTGYSITLPMDYRGQRSRLTFSSNNGTPLADWINGTLRSMQHCWVVLDAPTPEAGSRQ